MSTRQRPEQRRRWLILAVIGIAQLMVVLDVTVMNIALPSAQRALHFTTVDRQWVVTAYTLSFGSLLLLGGRLSDLFGRKVTFLIGLTRLRRRLGHRRRLGQFRHAGDRARLPGRVRRDPGAVGAVPADDHVQRSEGPRQGVRRLRRDRRGRQRRRPAARRRADRVPVLALDALHQPVLRGRGLHRGAVLLQRQPSGSSPSWTSPACVAVSSGLFCLVYGFSNAATHNWHTPSTYGFLAAGVALLVAFAFWQGRAASPLLPPRVVLDRNRGGAYLRC